MAEILVIDDETSMRELCYDLLARRGYTVLTAGSGPQAMEILKGHRPQLILLDSALSQASTLDLARNIREFDDAIPIILLKSAADDAIAEEERKRLRLDEAVSKEVGVELFVKGLDAAIKRAQEAAAHAARDVRVHGTLLVVDDDPQVQKLLKWFFESKGLRVIVAGSGEEGLKALAQRPLAVMLDINMPGMDGLVALKKIKAAQPSLTVIVASGMGEEKVVREALDAGAYDYVSKPFNLEYLESVVLTKVLLGMDG
jgi:CheY-like chemotaxis protein